MGQGGVDRIWATACINPSRELDVLKKAKRTVYRQTMIVPLRMRHESVHQGRRKQEGGGRSLIVSLLGSKGERERWSPAYPMRLRGERKKEE